MAGREYMGVVRSTLLIDPQGLVQHVWPNVKVKGHADEVLSNGDALNLEVEPHEEPEKDVYGRDGPDRPNEAVNHTL